MPHHTIKITKTKQNAPKAIKSFLYTRPKPIPTKLQATTLQKTKVNQGSITTNNIVNTKKKLQNISSVSKPDKSETKIEAKNMMSETSKLVANSGKKKPSLNNQLINKKFDHHAQLQKLRSQIYPFPFKMPDFSLKKKRFRQGEKLKI